MRGFKNDIRIDCRIVKTESGEMVKAEEVSGDIDDMLDLLKKLSRKVLKNLPIKLDEEVNQKIKRTFNLCSYSVLVEYFKALSSLEHQEYDSAMETLDKVIKKCPEFIRAVKLRNDLKSKLKK